MTEPPPFPEPLEDDDDDVAWALQTAKVQWNRGGQVDAIVWLRRAADSADQLGNVWRASDLRRMTDELEASLAVVEAPAAPLPQWEASSDVDDLLGAVEDSGVTSIPPPVMPPAPLSSYAPVDDFEVDDEPESFDEAVILADVDDDEPSAQVVQLLGAEVEVTEEVEVIDDELDDAEELDADVIEDDALSPEPAALPAPELADEGFDDPVTQPQLEDPRFASVPVPVPEPDPDPRVGEVLLAEVRGLEDVPPEGQAILAREARIERLGADEEVSSFGLALVLRGAVNVMPAIADLSCARANKGEIVWSEGNLDEGIALRLVAVEAATEVAVWDAELLKSTVRDYPWVVEDLKTLADRFQALAGVAMGPMGERLDDSLRATVTERCEIKRLLPGEALTTKGKPVGGMYIVAAGRLEVVDGDALESELGPGDFLFAPQVLSNGAAPRDSRAGQGGALVLFAGRGVAHELLLSVPPLLEIFAT